MTSTEEIIKDIIKDDKDDKDDNNKSLILALLLTADTESQFLENKAREIEFSEWDEDGTLLYNWQIVDDDRTTSCCRNIARRAGGGKSLEELRQIVNEESAKYNARNPHWEIRDWNPHVNCRGKLVIEKM